MAENAEEGVLADPAQQGRGRDPARLDVGAWGLFCGPGGRQLVLVGDEPCGPVSARKITRAVPRRLLLDEGRVAKVHETGDARTELVDLAGSQWVVALRPLRSPASSATVIGVLAIVVPAGEAIPEPPLVGTWEWNITRDETGMPTANRRMHWDENARLLYDVDPSIIEARRDFWQSGGSMQTLIAPEDQMRLNGALRDGVREGLAGIAGRFRCLTYDIITGYGSDRLGRRHMRLVGMMIPVEPDDELILVRGFSYEAPRDYHDVTLDQDVNAGRVDSHLRSVMELANQPMAVVDTTTLDVLMTSSSWRREGFDFIGGLGDVAVEDAGLQGFIAEAASDDTGEPRSRPLRLRLLDGGVQDVTLTVMGVMTGAQSWDAVVRLDT